MVNYTVETKNMKKESSSNHIIKFFISLWKVAPVLVWFMIISQIAFAILTMTIAPVFVSQLLTRISNGSATMQSSVGLLVAYAVILFMGDVVAPRITLAAAFVAESRMQANIYKRILTHLVNKSLGYHANKMSGGLVSDASKLNGSIERFWDQLIFVLIPIISTLVSICIVLGFILWQYAVVLAVLSIAFVIIVIKSQNAIAPISKKVATKSSKMTAYFADIISNIATVKAFSGEKSELNNYGNLTKIWYKAQMKEMKSVIIVTGLFGTMMTIMNVCAFIAAILATEYHIASIGSIYLVVSYTLNVVSKLWEVSQTTRTYIRVIGDGASMIKILDEDIEIKDPINPEKSLIKEGKLEFNNVTFTHNENTDALFKNLSFIVNPGEKIGLVGRSGSGKTSLTRLLLRFSDVEAGEILIDGQNITNIKQTDLHDAIAYVSQEPILFHRSLKENIAYGKTNATEEEIIHAADQANATEFIKTLPKGFDILVGERGIKLSGGQRQRIAIARAILKDAPILLLDEATSALDSETEKLIQDALIKLMKNRTSIVIAHRLSTISKLDRIIVLDNGNIIEQGAHKELLAAGGIYAKLWSRQSGNFIDE